MSTILTVTQINTYIKSILDGDKNLNNIYITGEISNFTNHYRTGHFYFSLKDDSCTIKAVMFRNYAENLKYEPYDGLKVLARCRVSLYEKDGTYQLYVTDMQPDGAGQLNLAFEQLKKRLENEGLFEQKHKKPLPPYPEKISVITSPTGAAIRDIINVISRRYPICELEIVPVTVQGEESSMQIVKAIGEVNRINDTDVIILARGGGSIEDLWSFNEEETARAIFKSAIPVVTGVGHETDFTISDFVADKRAPTPSAAAEIVTPDIRSIFAFLDSFSGFILRNIEDRFIALEYRLNMYNDILEHYSPNCLVKSYSNKITQYENILRKQTERLLQNKKNLLVHYVVLLNSLNPLKILERGYGIVLDENEKGIASVNDVKQGDNITVKMRDGQIDCVVKNASKN